MSVLRSRAVRGDRGATAVEYALISSLIAVVALVGIVLFGRNLSGSFEESTLAIEAAVDGADTGDAEAQAAQAAQAAAEAPTAQYATWTRVGNSRNYRWECPRGTSLGFNSIEQNTSTPPAPAPICT